MKNFKKVLLIFMLILFPFVSSGCWNYKEIDNIAIPAGVAVDKDPITKEYILTVEIINIISQGRSSSISSEIYTSKSKTMFDGIRNLIEITGLRLFWAHAKVLIVSEEIAKEGMIPVIDWCLRDSELRIDMWLLIARGSSAGEILKNKVNINNITSFHIDDIMKNGGIVYKFPDTNIVRFVSEISEEELSASVATIKNEKIGDKINCRVEGSAIFKGDKLVGYLNGNETMQMLMIKNKVHEGLITLKDIYNSHTDATLEIFKNETKLKPIYKDGKITMMIDLYTTVVIDELSGDEDFINENKRVLLVQDAEEKLKQNLQELTNKLQIDYDCDALGFEEFLERNNSKVLKELKKSNKDIFASIQTKINVHMTIKGSAKMMKPTKKTE